MKCSVLIKENMSSALEHLAYTWMFDMILLFVFVSMFLKHKAQSAVRRFLIFLIERQNAHNWVEGHGFLIKKKEKKKKKDLKKGTFFKGRIIRKKGVLESSLICASAFSFCLGNQKMWHRPTSLGELMMHLPLPIFNFLVIMQLNFPTKNLQQSNLVL